MVCLSPQDAELPKLERDVEGECTECGVVESVTIVPSSRPRAAAATAATAAAQDARVYVRYRRAEEAALALRTFDNPSRGGPTRPASHGTFY
jgi:hypothetical protein